jgi:hypothetical protein
MSKKSVRVDISSDNRGARAPASNAKAVARNLARFSDDFAVQATRHELADLKSQFVSSSSGGLRRAMPSALTEQASAQAALRDFDLSARQPSLRARGECGERSAPGEGSFRDRRGGTLFIDARKLGALVDSVHRELTDYDIARIVGTYHAWRGDQSGPGVSPGQQRRDAAATFQDVPCSCKPASFDDIREHGHALTPGRYVGAEAVGDDAEPFDEKVKRFAATLHQQQDEAAKGGAAIASNLKEVGYGN